ncbi:hypothetical protein ACIP79_00565 [Streptomyces sp. NPDC088747]|uniref:hypothetical protein n=1 Tax=Streptomyces sp. NPDC088747 TaxID=3365886 RepID=UPI003822794F
MSYDVALRLYVDAGGQEPFTAWPADIGNYTSNVSGMWTKALGYDLCELDNKTAGDCLADLQRAVGAMEGDPATYEAMNPRNGWGTYEGASDYLRRLRDACAAYPKATIRISC